MLGKQLTQSLSLSLSLAFWHRAAGRSSNPMSSGMQSIVSTLRILSRERIPLSAAVYAPRFVSLFKWAADGRQFGLSIILAELVDIA